VGRGYDFGNNRSDACGGKWFSDSESTLCMAIMNVEVLYLQSSVVSPNNYSMSNTSELIALIDIIKERQ
jgi:hypothetical protein